MSSPMSFEKFIVCFYFKETGESTSFTFHQADETVKGKRVYACVLPDKSLAAIRCGLGRMGGNGCSVSNIVEERQRIVGTGHRDAATLEFEFKKNFATLIDCKVVCLSDFPQVAQLIECLTYFTGIMLRNVYVQN